MMVKSSTFPELYSRRLLLNSLSIEDVDCIVKYANNENVSRHTLNIPFPYASKDAIGWIERAIKGFDEGNHYVFAIRQKYNQEFIGGIGLRLEDPFDRAAMGYWLAEPFWNKGIVTEAVACVLRFGFETLELNKIYAHHTLENPASGKVMIKNGMIKEAEMMEHFKKNGEYRNVAQYRLTKLEYQILLA
ncbi:MAG: GNAT family N-acetyltransferase [Bacteroidota bacterium]